MQYVSTRRRQLEQAVQQSPEGPWKFDFILTAEEFSRLYGASAATMNQELHSKRSTVPVLIWSLIVLLLLALAGPHLSKRLFKRAHRNIMTHTFVQVSHQAHQLSTLSV